MGDCLSDYVLLRQTVQLSVFLCVLVSICVCVDLSVCCLSVFESVESG